LLACPLQIGDGDVRRQRHHHHRSRRSKALAGWHHRCKHALSHCYLCLQLVDSISKKPDCASKSFSCSHQHTFLVQYASTPGEVACHEVEFHHAPPREYRLEIASLWKVSGLAFYCHIYPILAFVSLLQHVQPLQHLPVLLILQVKPVVIFRMVTARLKPHTQR